MPWKEGKGGNLDVDEADELQQASTQLPGRPDSTLSASVGVIDLRTALAPCQPSNLSVHSFK